MNTCLQSPTTMDERESMYWMAVANDIEGITRLLDEGVNPAANEERSPVRLMFACCIG